MDTNDVINKLISANHILHYHKCFDAFGHISVRSPANPDHFFMAKELAPALVSSDVDINVYAVSDAQTVAPYSPKGPKERFIHSEIYKMHPEIMSVCHSHDPALIPFGTALEYTTPAVHHMAGFLAKRSYWNGEAIYQSAAYSDQLQDMQVTDQHLGRSLARLFDELTRFVFMKDHGYTTVADSLELAVYQAIYSQLNAQIVQAVDRLKKNRKKDVSLCGLTSRQCSASKVRAPAAALLAWPMWVREVETHPMYRNDTRGSGLST